MTTPTGLLEWGQSGNYNGIDDRAVIGALSQGQALGLTGPPPALTAQSGLTIAIGPWRALVDCGDGTRAVIGSRTQQTINETAGGGATRTDVLWADINVDGGSWTASIVASPVSPTRTGVALGTITVPAGAATSAAMTFTPAVTASSGSYSTFDPTNYTVTQAAFNNLGAALVIPANEAAPGDQYEVEVFGNGTWGSTAQILTIQPSLGGASANLPYSSGYFLTGNTFRFRWVARLLIVAVGPTGSYIPMIWGEMSGQGNLVPGANSNQDTSGAFQLDYGANALDFTVPQTLRLQAKWASTTGASTLTGRGTLLRRRGVGL